MDIQTLSPHSFWTLIALAHGPNHTYAIAGKIFELTLGGFRPPRNSIRKTLMNLQRQGLVHPLWTEPGNASPNPRQVFEITSHGRHILMQEQRHINFANQAIKQALAIEYLNYA